MAAFEELLENIKELEKQINDLTENLPPENSPLYLTRLNIILALRNEILVLRNEILVLRNEILALRNEKVELLRKENNQNNRDNQNLDGGLLEPLKEKLDLILKLMQPKVATISGCDSAVWSAFYSNWNAKIFDVGLLPELEKRVAIYAEPLVSLDFSWDSVASKDKPPNSSNSTDFMRSIVLYDSSLWTSLREVESPLAPRSTLLNVSIPTVNIELKGHADYVVGRNYLLPSDGIRLVTEFKKCDTMKESNIKQAKLELIAASKLSQEKVLQYLTDNVSVFIFLWIEEAYIVEFSCPSFTLAYCLIRAFLYDEDFREWLTNSQHSHRTVTTIFEESAKKEEPPGRNSARNSKKIRNNISKNCGSKCTDDDMEIMSYDELVEILSDRSDPYYRKFVMKRLTLNTPSLRHEV